MTAVIIAFVVVALGGVVWLIKGRRATVDDAMRTTIGQAQEIGESKAEIRDAADDIVAELDDAADETDAAVDAAEPEPVELEERGSGLKIGVQKPTDFGGAS